MIVTLPLPHKNLSPNSRCHWRAKAAAVKAYRETARALAWRHGGNPLASAVVQCKFYFATTRRRDSDNLLASMKSCFDGLVDAGVFTDDSGLTHLPVVQARDKANPRVEIHILEEPL